MAIKSMLNIEQVFYKQNKGFGMGARANTYGLTGNKVMYSLLVCKGFEKK
jgi:hypothetical protein